MSHISYEMLISTEAALLTPNPFLQASTLTLFSSTTTTTNNDYFEEDSYDEDNDTALYYYLFGKK